MRSSISHSFTESWTGRLRSVALATGAAALLGIGSVGTAHAERVFSGISVDASAVGSSGSPLAQQIKATLEPGLRQSFASSLRPGDRSAPRLVVRITSVSIQSVPEFGRSGGFNTDFMEGEALVVGNRGAVIQRYPMLSALDNNVNAYYLPNFEERRVAALSNFYAYWLKRQLPDQ